MEYPWYAEIGDGSLDQGDILSACPAGYLPLDWDPQREQQRIQIEQFDLVVITQACDLAHEKTDYVVCCPVFAHSCIDEQFRHLGRKYVNSQKDKIARGVVPGYAMIAEHPGDPARPVSVVDFRRVFSLPKAFLRERASPRHLRLLPPYREHLSQSFARFFMRVGLPKDIPSFAQ
jgi:hypothetical protein